MMMSRLHKMVVIDILKGFMINGNEIHERFGGGIEMTKVENNFKKDDIFLFNDNITMMIGKIHHIKNDRYVYYTAISLLKDSEGLFEMGLTIGEYVNYNMALDYFLNHAKIISKEEAMVELL